MRYCLLTATFTVTLQEMRFVFLLFEVKEERVDLPILLIALYIFLASLTKNIANMFSLDVRNE